MSPSPDIERVNRDVRMLYGKYIFQRVVAPGVKKVYHKYNPETDVSQCRRSIEDSIVVTNLPSNRVPCRWCFGLKGKR